jgi:hypothetical protein
VVAGPVVAPPVEASVEVVNDAVDDPHAARTSPQTMSAARRFRIRTVTLVGTIGPARHGVGGVC